MGSATGVRRLWRFDPFELDGRSGELRKHGRRVRLQEKPLQLLELLLERPGDVVTREELCARLWPADTFVDFDAGLNTAINKVRTALGDSADEPRFVETLGRRGYRFLAPVESEPPAEEATPDVPAQVPPMTEEPATRDEVEPATTTRAADPKRPRRLRTATLIAAAVLLLATATTALLLRRSASPQIHSLAVLPLANLSGDPGQEYFAEGMTDALITKLAGIQSLRVISRQSVMQYQKSRKPLPEIARELAVDGVVEGSVVREGGRVRVTAQLLYAPTDRHLWANSYDRPEGDLLVLETELARTIAEEIRARVTPQEHRRLSSARDVAPEAYDAYLHGRYFWNRRSEANLRRGVEYYEKAIAADPAFAQAYAGLAETYGPLGYLGFMPPWEARPRMKAAALKAVELDPELAEGHTALAACLAFHEWNWAEAEKEFQRAIELDPRYPTAHQWYGLHLMAMGRFEEALRERLLALESDPLSPPANWGVASILAATGQTDAAIDRARKTLELDPTFYPAQGLLGRLYFGKGLREEGLQELIKADASSGGAVTTRAALATAYMKSGRTEEARKTVADLIARSKTRYVSPVDMAYLYASLGDTDRAFEWLERAYGERASALHMLKTTPMLEDLHGDPRFQDLLRRMNLT